MFDLSFEMILVYVLASGVGYIYFRYGRSMSDFKFMACGACFFFYPYFVDSIVALVLIGLVLGITPFSEKILNWLRGKFS